MALNREQKRLLQKRGELDADGEPISQRRQANRGAPNEERTSPGDFIKEVRGELKKVAWPSRAEVINYSIVVLVTLVAVTAFIGALDWGLGEALLQLFER